MPKTPTFTVNMTTVTPALAQKWLALNTGNRKVKPVAVARLADDMSNGRWRDTGDTIKLSTTGRLIDGQHRLHAIVESGVTATFLVVRGVEDSSQRYMDLGVKRSVADGLGMDGVANSLYVAAAGRLALAWTTDRLRNRARITDTELRQFIDEEPVLIPSAELASSWYTRGLPIAGSVIAAAYWGIVREGGNDADAVVEFFEDVTQLRTTGEGDPKKTLRARFDRAARQKEKVDAPAALSMVVRAWNFSVEGRELRRIQATSREGIIEVPRPLLALSSAPALAA